MHKIVLQILKTLGPSVNTIPFSQVLPKELMENGPSANS